MRKADFLGSLIWLGFGLSMLFSIIPMHVESGRWYGLSPHFYPQLISTLIVVFALLMLVSCVLKPDRYKGQTLDLNWNRFFQFIVFFIYCINWFRADSAFWHANRSAVADCCDRVAHG